MSIADKLKNMLGGGDDGWSEDARFRERHRAGGGTDDDYARLRPAYQYGHSAGSDPSYRGRNFAEVESHLRTHWNDDLAQRSGNWDAVRGHVHDGYRTAQETVLTRSEEELSIGRRSVEAGEVEVQKTVDTEHVSQRVPVTREEVVVDRRPVNEVRAAADMGDEVIRIPVIEEEIVVEKRPVVREEIVIRKHVVHDTAEVEADLRRERIDVDDRTRMHTRGDSDSADGTNR